MSVDSAIFGILWEETGSHDSWDTLQRVRANVSVLLRYTNTMPFKWVSNNYKCFFCSHMTFTAIEELRQHMRKEHEGYHSSIIIRQAVRASPSRIKIDITDMSCKLCSESFDSLAKMTDHLVDDHQKTYYNGLERRFFLVRLTDELLTCLDCGEQFSYFLHLMKHFAEKHEKEVFLCDTCGKGFEFYEHLKVHLQRQHLELKCNFCEKTFTNRTNRKAHESLRHKVGGYTCKECGTIFTSFYQMRQHALSAHDQGNRYTCKKCSVSFIYKLKLRRHERTVHEKSKEKCPICDALVVNLDCHLVCHSDDRPFACEVCQKVFARKKNMVAHLKTHKVKK